MRIKARSCGQTLVREVKDRDKITITNFLLWKKYLVKAKLKCFISSMLFHKHGNNVTEMSMGPDQSDA